ncbi:MAG TPA: rhomboid family intramembrane serine protease [Desulfuromonadaceae bacterium]|jgi:membrane associated rhomboid family serine protease
MEQATEHKLSDEGGWLTITPQQVVGGVPARLSERKANLWALVLEARLLPYRLENAESGPELLVPPEYLDAALNELRQFETENRGWPPLPPPARPLSENTLATLSVLVLIATFHNLTRLSFPVFNRYPDWIAIGNAQAGEILQGQWWRLVTALTLHADDLHLYSNLAIGGIFIIFLCRELGSGLAWSLLLASGTLGNLVNALVQPPTHSSVGASTAVFGAVGILSSLSFLRYRKQLQKRWLLPVAAALALLALLGTEGKQTDLGAHLFGFIFGIILGLLTELRLSRQGHPGRLTNAILGIIAMGVVASAWWVALQAAN